MCMNGEMNTQSQTRQSVYDSAMDGAPVANNALFLAETRSTTTSCRLSQWVYTREPVTSG